MPRPTPGGILPAGAIRYCSPMTNHSHWPARIVALGECMLELSSEGPLWRLGAAGDSFNTALYLARSGAQVRYFTALGADPFSQDMLHDWQAENIDCSLVLRDSRRLPGLYAIRTDAHGERSFFYWRSQSAARALFELQGVEAALEAAAHCDLLYLTGITLSLFDAAGRARLCELARKVRTLGGRVAFDPNFRPQGWPDVTAAREAMNTIASLSDILLTTDSDERALWGFGTASESITHWHGLGAREVIVKQGGQGATASLAGEICTVPVPRAVKVVDTTGAGDSFNAAYLAARLRGATTAEAAAAGHELAGQVIQIRGAILPRAKGSSS